MAALSGNLIAWTYTDDRGTAWRTAAKKAITDQLIVAAVKVGGEPAASSLPKLPSWIKPRKRYLTNGTIIRSVVCYDTVCEAWADASFTINLMTGADADEFTGTPGRYAERSRTGIVQSA